MSKRWPTASRHHQALVGDQTIAFRLMNKQMYTDMNRAAQNVVIDRGMALHKMIRLSTYLAGGTGLFEFYGATNSSTSRMVSISRVKVNGWSYAHARRLWVVFAQNGFLRYSYLGAFDRAMPKLVRKYDILGSGYAYNHLRLIRARTKHSHSVTGQRFSYSTGTLGNSIPDYDDPGSGTGPLPDRTDFRALPNSAVTAGSTRL